MEPAGLQRGIAQVFSSPLQTIREDFGTVAVRSHVLAEKDTFAAIYTIDDGDDFTRDAAQSLQQRTS